MSYAYPTPVCDEDELKALASMFKGNETAASAFCDKLGARVGGIEEGVNTFFLTIMGALVFVMHAGFAMVRAAGGQHMLQLCANAAACQPHSSKAVLRASSSLAIMHPHSQAVAAFPLVCAHPADIVAWVFAAGVHYLNMTLLPLWCPAVVCWCHSVQEHHEHSPADHSGCCSVCNLLVPDWVSLVFPLFSCTLSDWAEKATACSHLAAFLGALAYGLQSCAQACEEHQTTCKPWLDISWYLVIQAHSFGPAGAALYAPVFA